MQYIPKNKKPIPKSLEDFRKSPHANYNDFKDKSGLRKILLEEQGSVCAYCLQPISEDNMKIEHWAPQSKHPEKQLDYYNLLAVCKGQEGKTPDLQHCDTRKGNQEITINPTKENCETLVQLHPNGRLFSPVQNVQNEIDTILNLNQKFLVKYRQDLLQRLNTAYRQKKGDIKFLKEKLNEYTEKPYKPFARFVRDWLGKKIKRQQFKEK